MESYRRVENPKPDVPISENEIRITTQGAVRNYITYAISLLQEKQANEIVLKAMGQAISKTVAIVEIIKKRVPMLHQDTAINSVSITDVWEPIEEGLVPLEMTRHVSMIAITLSTKEHNTTSVGYQAPSVSDQSKSQSNYHPQQPRHARGPYNAVNEDLYGRGRGRVRGRGRGRGGGYNNYHGAGYGNHEDQDNGGYPNQGRRGGYNNYQGGYRNYQGGDYGNHEDNLGYRSRGRGGGYNNYHWGEYGNYHDDGGYSNRGRGGGRGRTQGYRGTGFQRGSGDYERGRGQGGRGYGFERESGNFERGRGQGGRGYGRERDSGEYERGRGQGGRGYGLERDSGDYERGRGQGGRGYGRGRGRMGGHSRGGANQA